MSIQKATSIGWDFWFRWVAASTIGWGVGFAAGASMMTIGNEFLFGALVGAGVGIMQWLVLRREIRKAGGWIRASIIGCIVGWFVGGGAGIFDGGVAFGAVMGALVGAGVGIMQWLVLRREIRKTGWWILASIIGWTVVVAVFGDVIVSIFKSGGEQMVAFWAVIGGGVGGGAITGLALVWLLRQPRKEP